MGLIMVSAHFHASERAEGKPMERWTVAVFPSGAQFTLELALTDQERGRGYMDREEVGEHEGMLFVFDRRGRHGMWMRNCRANLDIIWLDDRFRVVDMALDLSPCSEAGKCRTVFPSGKADFVLEVAGGRAEAEGLRLGDTIVTLSDGNRP
jgi:uncharacterized membrane protein (UPF0127 family)